MSVEDSPVFQGITIALLCILSLVTVIINALCMIVIRKSPTLLKRPSTYFILNLLAVHLIQGLIVFPLYAVKKARIETLEISRLICDGFRFSYMITFYAAILSVLLIVLDRLIATRCILQYRSLATKHKIRWCIVLMWLYTVVLCLIPFTNVKQSTKELHTSEYSNATNTFINKTKTITYIKCHYNQSEVWTITMLGLNCMLPYLVIVVLYQAIVYMINKTDRRTRSMTTYSLPEAKTPTLNDGKRGNDSPQSVTSKCRSNTLVHPVESEPNKHKHITYVAMILSIAYFFFWTPSVIYFILWSVCPQKCFAQGFKGSDTETYIGFTTKYLAFLDALAAPLIYCLYQEEFRKFLPGRMFRRGSTIKLLPHDHSDMYTSSAASSRDHIHTIQNGHHIMGKHGTSNA